MTVTEEEMPDYGSGPLGNWQAYTPYITPDSTLAQVRDTGGIVVIGDSIAHGCRPALQQMINGHGVNVGFNAWPGRPTAPAVDALEGMISRGLQPPQLLMISGANDVCVDPARPGSGPPAFAAEVDQAMALMGPDRPVYWVTTYVDRWAYPAYRVEDAANTAVINGALYRAAGQYPNLQLVDWHLFLRSKPGSAHPPAYPSVTTLPRPAAYTRDGLHPDVQDGIDAYVYLVDQRIDWT